MKKTYAEIRQLIATTKDNIHPANADQAMKPESFERVRRELMIEQSEYFKMEINSMKHITLEKGANGFPKVPKTHREKMVAKVKDCFKLKKDDYEFVIQELDATGEPNPDAGKWYGGPVGYSLSVRVVAKGEGAKEWSKMERLASKQSFITPINGSKKVAAVHSCHVEVRFVLLEEYEKYNSLAKQP